MKTDLQSHWEVITEGAQTILRADGLKESYNQLKAMVRGKELTEEIFSRWVEDLEVDGSVKEKLRALSPLTYTGLAQQIAERALLE
jgi:adenylosuccinate lyase